MAQVTPLPMLKRQRERLGRPRHEIAEAMGVPEATLAAWERDPSLASDAQLADLSLLLWLPWIPPGEETAAQAVYGSLKIEVPRHSLEYPVDCRTRDQVLDQLAKLDLQEFGNATKWLSFTTLNNKMVFANPEFIREVELVSDDAEQTLDFEHPAVYAALERWDWDELDDVGPIVRSACERELEANKEATHEATHARIISSRGKVSWHFLLEDEDTLGYFTLGLAPDLSERNRFLCTTTEGPHRARFVNLSHVAVIEVPKGRYERISGGEEECDTSAPEAGP